MIRMAQSEIWATMVVRGISMAAVFAVVWMLFRRQTNPFRDRDWVTVGIAWGCANIFFTASVFLTSTANLVFILAFNPMIAALLSWAIIGERPAAATWAAILATLGGVAIIVAGGLDRGTGWGDIAAVLCASCIAYSLVVSRKSGMDMSLAPGLGSLITVAVAIPFLVRNGAWPGNIWWLLANGLVLIPAASYCLALAPRYIAAEQVAMFYLLETVLAPVWVWAIFSEVPSRNSLIGGAILIAALVAHSAWQLHEGRKRRAATGIRHPA